MHVWRMVQGIDRFANLQQQPVCIVWPISCQKILDLVEVIASWFGNDNREPFHNGARLAANLSSIRFFTSSQA